MNESTLINLVDVFLRWVHVASGITWIGILYWFNFVNPQIGPTMDAETKKKMVPEYMPRSLFFFRWGAMFTFVFGLALFYKQYVRLDGMNLQSPAFQWILTGMLFGTIMWFNVWFIIWPAQQKVIPAVKAGTAGEGDIPALAKRAGTASKINTYLSFPLIWAMLSGRHFGAFGAFSPGGIAIIVVALMVPWAIYKFVAPNVKGM